MQTIQQQSFASQPSAAMQNTQPANQQKNAAPRYVPHFSALDQAGYGTGEDSSSSETGGAPDTASPDTEPPPFNVAPASGAPHPFHNGGAVPPEQTAGSAGAYNEHTSSDSEPGDLRSRAIADLSLTEAITAAALMQTGPWIRNGENVTAQIDSAFQQKQLEGQSAKLSEYLTKLCGQKTVFHVIEKEHVASRTMADAPVEVQLLCRMFKGAIVGHSANDTSVQNTTGTQEQQVDSSSEKNDASQEDESASQNENQESMSEYETPPADEMPPDEE